MRLTEPEVQRYQTCGAVFPIRVFSEVEMAGYLRRFEDIETSRAGRLPPMLNFKPHLLVPWLWDIVHDPRILDTVECILGPDILCWASSFFAKGANDPAHVPWHQDATYWGLSAPHALTAWVAFTPSIPENGCMRVVFGSHHGHLAHGDTLDADNMLPGREEVLVDVDEDMAMDVVLAPGEMSLHHLLLVHGSKPNTSSFRRVGFAIRYIAGHLRQTGAERGSATLVRGKDQGHFEIESKPEGEFHPEAMARHTLLLRRWMKIVFTNTASTRAMPAIHSVS